MEIKVLSVISIILGIISIISPKTTITKLKNEKKAQHMPSDDLKKEMPYSLIKEKDKANYSKKEIREARIMGVFIILLGILFLKLAMLGII